MPPRLNSFQMFISGAEFTGGIVVGAGVWGLAKIFNSPALRGLAQDIHQKVDQAQQQPIRQDITRLQRAAWCIGYASCLGVFGFSATLPVVVALEDGTIAKALEKPATQSAQPSP